MKYYPTIGLEIHAELKTKTKMFCNSLNDPEEKRPNVNICPICMGHPGTLPTVNKEAVKSVLKVGLAIGGELADFTEFDRKNYFYPDIPKGYQISQYKFPLVKGGYLEGVNITRVHLEEDTAKSTHAEGASGSKADDYSLVDFNRAGVPLMELVTEPVIKTAEQASAFGKELQLLLRYLGVSDANMEKGQMRVEANVSVSPVEDKFGTKVEVKNLNSFRAVERAIQYELQRQAEVLDQGGKVVQETRGWDENRNETFSQRQKEESHDYRYFPDPDIPKLKLSELPEFSAEALKEELPELPAFKRERLAKTFGLKPEELELFIQMPAAGSFFEAVASSFKDDSKLAKLASNYISSDLMSLVNAERGEEAGFDVKIKPADFALLILMTAEGKLSSRGAKDTLKVMFEHGGNPMEIATEKKLLQENDESALKKIAETVVAENQKVAGDYRGGKATALQFLIGQCMRLSKGSGNPQVFRELLQKILG